MRIKGINVELSLNLLAELNLDADNRSDSRAFKKDPLGRNKQRPINEQWRDVVLLRWASFLRWAPFFLKMRNQILKKDAQDGKADYTFEVPISASIF